MRAITRLILTLLGGVSTVLCCHNCDAQVKTIPGKIQEHLQHAVATAIASDDSAAIVTSLQPLLTGSNHEIFPEVSVWFQSKGFNSLESYLGTHWTRLIAQNQNDLVEKPNAFETLVLLPVLDESRKDFLVEIKNRSIAQDPLQTPDSDKEYARMLNDANLLIEKLRLQKSLVKFGDNLVNRFKHACEKNSKELGRDGKVFQVDYRLKQSDLIDSKLVDIQERMIELRYYRLEDAVEILKSSPQMIDRFRACLTLADDASELNRLFVNLGDHQFVRENLQLDNLDESIQQLIEEGKTAAGDLYDKAVALNQGLHWWKRGRYGQGPLANGLLRYEPLINRNARTQSALLMPDENPVPIDPYNSKDGIEPNYPRRHYYTWALEERPGLQVNSQYNVPVSTAIESWEEYFPVPRTIVVQPPCSNESVRIFYEYGKEVTSYQTQNYRVDRVTKFIPPADRDFIYRIVGMYEYSQAVEILSDLVANSTTEEINAYNVIIGEHPEFEIYVGMAPLFQKHQSYLNLNLKAMNADQRNKSGLEWIIALARMELGANVAAYTDKPGPFLQMGLEEFELAAFKEILLDDLRSHLLALQNFIDRNRDEVKQSRWLDNDMPAQARRLKMIYAMLEATGRLMNNDMNDQDRNELEEIAKLTEKSFRTLRYEVATAIGQYEWSNPDGGPTISTRSSPLIGNRPQPAAGNGSR